jgi:hypothetical protein
VKDKAAVRNFRTLVEMVDPIGVERRGTALDAMDKIAEANQVFSEIGTVLAGEPVMRATLVGGPGGIATGEAI